MTKDELKALLMSVKDDPEFADVFGGEVERVDLSTYGGKKQAKIIDGKDDSVQIDDSEKRIAEKTAALKGHRVPRPKIQMIKKVCACGRKESVAKGSLLDVSNFICNRCLG